ncbi:LPS export ABC transporter permease LptF [Rhodobacter ferrooxidans]|uniref:Permease YjgP/YjgQ family protein n=1 Tax=Rhodobacter ferrooxidans TaxID=371731 RepID=C8S3V5_9RHOB|nr:LPS export ABC transporter permease LptF [Rhodobacter sp. SW2]EEW24324.1 permease YjgP/YjgQ family protein [Rhodobacter sp. SW2]
MSRFDRYLLSQLLALFGFFSLVLVAVYWINRAVLLFDKLIGDGQSALVFLEFSLLTLPSVIMLVLPFSAFVATVYGINRLTRDSELVVMQATGFSPLRLARPVAIFGLIVAAMMAVLLHVLVPESRATLAQRTLEVSENLAARFLMDGQFMHPAKGITLYIREISPKGELRDVFLADTRSPTSHATYTASRALLVKGDSGPKLVMLDGMVQNLNNKEGRMSVTRFADFTYDLATLIAGPKVLKRNASALSTYDLLWPSAEILQETAETPEALWFQAHNRLAQPILGLAAALIGFSALLLGAFSRFGLWRQIAVAVALMITVQGIATTMLSLGLKQPEFWPLAYAAPLAGLAMAAGLLWLAQRPQRLRQPGSAEAVA